MFFPILFILRCDGHDPWPQPSGRVAAHRVQGFHVLRVQRGGCDAWFFVDEHGEFWGVFQIFMVNFL